MTFEDLLARDGYLVYRTKGESMEPMLRQNRDLVTIQVPETRLKKYEVALYKRGKDYVLHRVLDVKKGFYLIRGDNTFSMEHVPDSAVIGVLTSFQRKSRVYSVTDRNYLLYVRFWCSIYPLRFLYNRFRRLAVRLARKMGILPLLKRLLGRDRVR